MKHTEQFSGKKKGEWASRQKRQDRNSNGSGQKNKTEDSKVDSNDSPEIQDKGETSDLPGLRSGREGGGMQLDVRWMCDTHS